MKVVSSESYIGTELEMVCKEHNMSFVFTMPEHDSNTTLPCASLLGCKHWPVNDGYQLTKYTRTTYHSVVLRVVGSQLCFSFKLTVPHLEDIFNRKF